VKGRKRHLVVDTMGLVMAASVTSAGLQDDAFEAVGHLLWRLCLKGWSLLKVIWADGMYEGSAVMWANVIGGWMLRIVRRSDDVGEQAARARGFVALPKRWVVERTFAWLGRYRRMSKDYEFLTDSSETMIYLAMTNLMLHRLSPG
jgi:putative transposase